MYQPLFARPLAAWEKEELERSLRSSDREDSWRAEAILLSAKGRTAVEISKELGYHPSNIKKWIRTFNREGIAGIAAKKRGPLGGPRPKFTRQQTDEIIKLSTVAPRESGYSFKTWTPQKLADAAVERGIVESISHVTVRQILKKHESPALSADNGTASGVPSSGIKGTIAPGASRFQQGKEALARSNFEEAAEHLYAALSEGASSPEEEAITRSMLSQSLEELSRFEDAHEVIKKYEDSKELSRLTPPTRARAKLRIGWAQSYLRNFPKAIASLNEAKVLFLELQDELGISEVQYALGRTYIE
ncbi:MAG: helix-turn-helix domain-containing protein, partial [Nitrososphaera sp.]|nr:helix-turn-helix domain-containing protein [Nitrososphaera sp.]